MGKGIVQKILEKHIVEGKWEPGKEIAIKIDPITEKTKQHQVSKTKKKDAKEKKKQSKKPVENILDK